MTDTRLRSRTTPPPEDDVAELFRKAGEGNAAGVAEIVHFRPELARCRNAAGLSILQFARYMREEAVLNALVEAGPPLDIFEASEIDDEVRLTEALNGDSRLVFAYTPDGNTALHRAAACGSTRSISLLIEGGAQIEALSRDEFAQTPLHSAVHEFQAEAVRTLLRHGADPNARRRDGETSLMIAAGANNREIAEMLVARNANIDVRDINGRSATDIAVARGHLALGERLRLGERIVDRNTA